MQHWQKYDSKACHQYAKEHFNSQQMAKAYMEKYIRILDGEKLNTQKPKLLQVQPKFLAWNQ